MTMLTPYQSSVAAPRPPGFWSLLLAEWTKLRTVRGFIIALLLIIALPVGVTLLGHSQCSVGNSSGQTFACPAPPTGPDGEAVDDNLYFVHQALPAHGSVTARVTGLAGEYAANGGIQVNGAGELTGMAPGTQPWSKAGIMIKASTRPGSAYAAMLVTGSNGVRMQWDYAGDVAGLGGTASAAAPRWLRLVRSGSEVTGYDSLDGSSWAKVGGYDVRGLPAGETVQVGLFATSPSYVVFSQSFGSSSARQGPSLATGTFDRVSVSGTSGPGSWTGTSIGSGAGAALPGQRQPSGPVAIFDGSYHQAGPASFTVSGSGDIAPDVPGAPDSIGASVQSAVAGMFAALIVVIIVAALFMAAEYRRGMIRLTLAAAPSRWQVLAAKSVVIFLATFVVSLIAVGVTLPVGLHLLRAGGNPVDPISALTEARMIVGTALLLGVCAVLALAMATIARRAVLAIVAVVVVIFVPYMLTTVGGLLNVSAQEWLLRVLPVSAFSVQQAYPAYHQILARYTPENAYYPLSPWAGLGVLAAWTAVALLAAGWLLRRRDA